jgi:hypothetical protein
MIMTSFSSVVSINGLSIWFNGCCCCPWFSDVSKISSILISWLVPPHTKSGTRLLPDNLHGDHEIVLRVEENSHVLLYFCQQVYDSTLVVLLFLRGILSLAPSIYAPCILIGYVW